MSYNARRILTPGASRKRKESEAFYNHPSNSTTSPKQLLPPSHAVNRAVSGSKDSRLPPTTSSKGLLLSPSEPPLNQPASSNRLLAGYMAYEFLTKGTLFGQKYDPARAEAVPVHEYSKRNRQQPQLQLGGEAEPSGKPKPKQPQGYAEVANVLKSSDGAHIPGIVNPTQLARWLQK